MMGMGPERRGAWWSGLFRVQRRGSDRGSTSIDESHTQMKRILHDGWVRCGRVVALGMVLMLGAGAARAQGTLVSGAVHDGEIGGATETDNWTFSGKTGDLFLVRLVAVTRTGNFTPTMRILGPGGAVSASGTSASVSEVSYRAAATGDFTLEVKDGTASRAGTGTYRIQFVRVPGAQTIGGGDDGGELVNGGTQSGAVDKGDLDPWTIPLTTGDTVVVRIGKVTDIDGFVPWLRLVGPDGAVLDNAFAGSACEVLARAPSTGVYTVVVADGSNGRSGSGNYRIHTVRTPGSTEVAAGDEGGVLIPGGTQPGKIHTGDLDVWTVDALTGDSLVVRVGEVADDNGFTPWVRVYAPNGTLVGNGFAGGAAEVAFRATATGTYTVVVADGSNARAGTGTYRIHLAHAPGTPVIAAQDEGGPLTVGGTQEGTIHVGDLDVWTIEANSGDTILVRVGEVVDQNGWVPWVRLYGPDGAPLDNQFNPAASEVTTRASLSGVYTVVVADGSNGRNATGTYRIHAIRAPGTAAIAANDEGGALNNGATQSGTIHVGDLDMWTVNVTSGEMLVVRVGQVSEQNGFVPWLRIYAPNGSLFGNAFSTAACEVAARTTASGVYTVVVGDGTAARAATGSYRIHTSVAPNIPVIDAGDEGGPLVNGGTQPGVIHVGDLDVWTLTAAAGDSILVRVGEVTDEGGFVPWLRLIGPDGAQLDNQFAASAAEVGTRATAAGNYSVIVADGSNGRAATGTYRIHLVKAFAGGAGLSIAAGDEGGALVPGSAAHGKIHVGDLDAWTFTGCEGDSYQFEAIEVGGNTPFVPWIRLYARDGALIGSAFHATSAKLAGGLKADGTYTLVIGDGASGRGEAGEYQITAAGIRAGLVFCPPRKVGGNFSVTGAGGTPQASFVVWTSPDVTRPAAQWTPILTNQFGVYGEFNLIYGIQLDEKSRYIRLLQP